MEPSFISNSRKNLFDVIPRSNSRQSRQVKIIEDKNNKDKAEIEWIECDIATEDMEENIEVERVVAIAKVK